MSLDEYILRQRDNLDRLRKLPQYALMAQAVDLYGWAIELMPHESPTIYGRSLLFCHRAVLSATALTAQGQPEDAAAVTRRAIEGALVCFAFKFDRQSFNAWMDLNKRIARAQRLREGGNPGNQNLGCGLPKDHPKLPLRKELRRWASLLSEKEVHLSPSHYLSERWRRIETPAGSHLVLDYFETNVEAIQRQLVTLAVIHFHLLETLDECLDRSWSLNDDWRVAVQRFVEATIALNPRDSLVPPASQPARPPGTPGSSGSSPGGPHAA